MIDSKALSELTKPWCIKAAETICDANSVSITESPDFILFCGKCPLSAAVLLFKMADFQLKKVRDDLSKAQSELYWMKRSEQDFLEIREARKVRLDENRVGGIRESVFQGNLDAVENDIVRVGKRIEQLTIQVADCEGRIMDLGPLRLSFFRKALGLAVTR